MNLPDVTNVQAHVSTVPERADRPETKPANRNVAPVRAHSDSGDAEEAKRTNERKDTYKTAAFADRSALYDVADIQRRGGGHILPRFQVVRRVSIEGNQQVVKMVDVALATERKSLKIYRKE
jgi:hypothetical protein